MAYQMNATEMASVLEAACELCDHAAGMCEAIAQEANPEARAHIAGLFRAAVNQRTPLLRQQAALLRFGAAVIDEAMAQPTEGRPS